MRGYRGIFREFSRTGTWRAFWLELRTGVAHVAQRLLHREGGDPVARFLEHYGEDGVRAPDERARALALQAEACLVCGLCTAECARVGGAPPLDPRDAVVSAARLEVDWIRHGLSAGLTGCASCAACDRVCPAGIPIHRVQERLASLAPDRAAEPGIS